jgi:hypothetical protein
VDIDGRAHYSIVIPVQAGKNLSVRVAPNPASETATVYIACTGDGTAAISVLDVNGLVVWRQKAQLRNGSNAVPLTGLNHLSRGTYFIRVTSPDGVLHQKLVLQ